MVIGALNIPNPFLSTALVTFEILKFSLTWIKSLGGHHPTALLPSRLGASRVKSDPTKRRNIFYGNFLSRPLHPPHPLRPVNIRHLVER